jgi:hypothetical protein
MSIQDQIVEEAKTWIGVPFRHAGRNRLGLDCAGLVAKVAHEVGISTFDSIDYPKRPNPHDFLRGIGQEMQRIPKSEAGHGDVMVFAEPRHPCHCGIIEVDAQGQLWIIHAYALARKVVREHLTGERLKRARLAFRYVEPS